MIIYQITNKVDGKIYIGQTIQELSKRIKSHFTDKSSHCTYLRRAINKYGRKNFEIKIVSTCKSPEEMNLKEAYYIEFFNSLAPNGYNLDSGGNNKKISEITKKKMSHAHMGKKRKPFSDEHRLNISRAHFGKSLSQKHKQSISLATRGSKNPNYGKKRSSETNEKIVLKKQRPIYVPEINKYFISIKEAAKKLNIKGTASIHRVLSGEKQTFRGYTFKRA